MDNEKDIMDQWEKNISGLITDQEATKKKTEELEKKLSKLDGDSHRRSMKSGNIPEQSGLEIEFEQAVRNPDNMAKLERLKSGESSSIKFELKAVQDMTFSNVFSSATSAVAQVRPGIVAPAPKKNHIRDFLPGVSSYTRDYVYVKETSVDGGPRFTREGSTKAQMSLNLSQVTATSQYLAAWVTISNQLLNDVNGMIPYLQGRLIQTLLDYEDTALISGDGATPNIGGLHLAGNYTGPFRRCHD